MLYEAQKLHAIHHDDSKMWIPSFGLSAVSVENFTKIASSLFSSPCTNLPRKMLFKKINKYLSVSTSHLFNCLDTEKLEPFF